MLTGYFDEAEGGDSGFTFVCGWISNVGRWERFAFDWKLLLSSHNLPYFHMKEFSQSRGPFEKWKNNEGSRRKFLSQAADVIHNAVQRACICGVKNEDFTRIRNEYPVSLSSPYALAGRMCIAWSNAWCRHTQPSLSVKYVFEDGGPDKRGLKASIAHYPHAQLPTFEPSRNIAGKRGAIRHGLVQLQAADFLAYEIRKFVQDHPKYKTGERNPRISLGLLTHTPADIRLYGYDRLVSLCQAVGLSRN